MALKQAKTTTASELAPQSAAPLITDINLEDVIADQLLEDIDWSKVRSAILKKAPAKLFAWLTSGNNPPVNISPFPELAALESAEEEEKAA